MRRLLLLLTLMSSTIINAQELDNLTNSAIAYINQGFLNYGFKELENAAAYNKMAAQYYLGYCYENGIIVDKNSTIAFDYFRKAAVRGLPDAMYQLANYYQKGIVVQQNNTRYKEWISRFEKRGGKMTLPDMTVIYNEGATHPENYALNPTVSYGKTLALQNNGNISTNNTIGSNNQTVNNITIVQAAPIQSAEQTSHPIQQPKPKSDVDQDIPSSTNNNDNTFALIIANENYHDVANVPNAINDGEIFAEYCIKTLGVPTTNVSFVKDATLNNIKREVSKLSKIADVYKGVAKLILYYAGHGIPDEATKDAFLLPVDGYGTDTSTGYSLKDLYITLGNMPTERIVVFLDACFCGTQRGDGMLASARGVAIKAKPNKAEGKMVIISAAQGDETAYSYEEQRHGLFTYFLLKKLKDSHGNVSLGDLASYIKDNVSKKSIVVNGKSQTPSINPSASLGESWKSWTLK